MLKENDGNGKMVWINRRKKYVFAGKPTCSISSIILIKDYNKLKSKSEELGISMSEFICNAILKELEE